MLYDELKRLGGNPIMYRTGHSLIKAKMKQEHAELAGEMSGHMFCDRYSAMTMPPTPRAG